MKYIFIFISIITLNQCSQPAAPTHFIEGKAPGVTNGLRVYYNSLDNNGRPVVIDTSIVMEEKFFFDKKEEIEKEEIRFLTLDGSQGNFILLVKDKKMEITLKKDSIHDSYIKGSPSTTTLQDFKKKQGDFINLVKTYRIERSTASKNGDMAAMNAVTQKWTTAENEYKDFSKNLITTHKNSVVAPMILGELLNSKMMDAVEARNFYNQFDEDVKTTDMATRIDAFLKQAESVAVGAKAPEFEGASPDGEIIKLKDVLGEVTLIDFWASWCGPCRRENPNVVSAYNKYHDKGFNIISVSLDRQNGEQAWKDAIKKDKMDWNHISRLQYFGPIARQYNVSSIPSTFLLDKDGVIIATNLRGQQLHKKLEELLGDS